MFQEPTCHSMTCFMEGNNFLFFGKDNLVFLFKTSDNAVYSILKVLHIDCLLISTRSDQRGFITYIGDFRSSKAWRLCRKFFHIYSKIKLDRLQVNFKYCFSTYDIWLIDADLAIEASWSE